jgi:hypothetical protein
MTLFSSSMELHGIGMAYYVHSEASERSAAWHGMALAYVDSDGRWSVSLAVCLWQESITVFLSISIFSLAYTTYPLSCLAIRFD